MKITATQGEIQNRKDEALVINLFQGTKRPGGSTGAVDQALGGLIRRAITDGDFVGKRNEILLLYTHGKIFTSRVLVVGLGEQKAFDTEAARQAAGTAARKLQNLGINSASTILHGAGSAGLAVEISAEATAEASILACYDFHHYCTPKDKTARLQTLTIVEFDKSKITAARRGIRMGQAIASAPSLARDLATHPGNTATPTYLAQEARKIARNRNLFCQVIDEKGMARLGMGALLGVAQGSEEPARFIVLEYNKAKREKPLVFVGKGVTFDSGGISVSYTHLTLPTSDLV